MIGRMFTFTFALAGGGQRHLQRGNGHSRAGAGGEIR